MAKTKSQKKLTHLLKNGVNFDPRSKRGDFGAIKGTTQTDTNLIQEIRRQEKKYKKRTRDYLSE